MKRHDMTLSRLLQATILIYCSQLFRHREYDTSESRSIFNNSKQNVDDLQGRKLNGTSY